MSNLVTELHRVFSLHLSIVLEALQKSYEIKVTDVTRLLKGKSKWNFHFIVMLYHKS